MKFIKNFDVSIPLWEQTIRIQTTQSYANRIVQMFADAVGIPVTLVESETTYEDEDNEDLNVVHMSVLVHHMIDEIADSNAIHKLLDVNQVESTYIMNVVWLGTELKFAATRENRDRLVDAIKFFSHTMIIVSIR